MCRKIFLFILQSCWFVGGVRSIEKSPPESLLNIQTVKTSFSMPEIIPNTTFGGDSNTQSTSTTNAISHPDHHATEKQGETTNHHMCSNETKFCKDVMRQCTNQIVDRMTNPMGVDYESRDFRCECLAHCIRNPEQLCLRLMRRINRRRHEGDKDHDNHSVLDHLGELIGTFGTGMVLGVFMALLMANVIKRRLGDRPEAKNRDTRSNSDGGLPAALRAPMPPPVMSSEGIYTEGPIVGPPPKYDRVSSKGLYEDLDGNESNGGLLAVHRSSSKVTGQNVYFVLEAEKSKSEDESEKEEDADNMPNENMGNQLRPNSQENPDAAPKPKPRKREKPPRNLKPDSEETKM